MSDEPKVTRLPARKAKGAFDAQAWSVKRTNLGGKTSAHKSNLRATKLLAGGRKKK